MVAVFNLREVAAKPGEQVIDGKLEGGEELDLVWIRGQTQSRIHRRIHKGIHDLPQCGELVLDIIDDCFQRNLI